MSTEKIPRSLEFVGNEIDSALTKGDAQKLFAQVDYMPPEYRSEIGNALGSPVPRVNRKLRSYVDSQELSSAPGTDAAPVGEKPVVLAEVVGENGLLREIWYAASPGGAGISSFVESGGRVRIFINDDASPAFEMALCDFFMYGIRGGEFDTPHFGRTAREANGDSGAYRRLAIPFQTYLRVEFVGVATNTAPVYGSVSYTLGDEVEGHYRVLGSRANCAPYERVELEYSGGPGQLEHVYLAGRSNETFDYAFLESNVEIYIDGADAPQILSSGAEDFFAGSWYRVPIGGFPTGRAGMSDHSGSSIALWKFFTNQPVVFEESIRIVIPVGQRTQGELKSAWYDIALYAGLFVDDERDSSYYIPAPTAVFDDKFSYPAGTLAGTPWQQPGDRAQATLNGSELVFPYGTTDSHMDMRVMRTGLVLPATPYFFSGKVSIGPGDTNQELGLSALGQGDGYYGDAVHVQVARVSQYVWQLRCRDGFDTVHQMQIGNGSDLVDRPIWLGLAVLGGGKVRAYWKLTDNDHWRPVGGWTTTRNGTATGVFSWQAGGKVDEVSLRRRIRA